MKYLKYIAASAMVVSMLSFTGCSSKSDGENLSNNVGRAVNGYDTDGYYSDYGTGYGYNSNSGDTTGYGTGYNAARTNQNGTGYGTGYSDGMTVNPGYWNGGVAGGYNDYNGMGVTNDGVVGTGHMDGFTDTNDTGEWTKVPFVEEDTAATASVK